MDRLENEAARAELRRICEALAEARDLHPDDPQVLEEASYLQRQRWFTERYPVPPGQPKYVDIAPRIRRMARDEGFDEDEALAEAGILLAARRAFRKS